jgi:hypothetical protein
MGRNIDLDDMINWNQTQCHKCKHHNVLAFTEFDIDCYLFVKGVCKYEYECEICHHLNKVVISVNIQNVKSKPKRK